ncbi:MAG: hypothetical protein M1834_002212 [Cirrosporium novae-zelandiae]|nr:MAG: hypothetical protein M1834_002212 [Cirrosporium novae-zelandiae]
MGSVTRSLGFWRSHKHDKPSNAEPVVQHSPGFDFYVGYISEFGAFIQQRLVCPALGQHMSQVYHLLWRRYQHAVSAPLGVSKLYKHLLRIISRPLKSIFIRPSPQNISRPTKKSNDHRPKVDGSPEISNEIQGTTPCPVEGVPLITKQFTSSLLGGEITLRLPYPVIEASHHSNGDHLGTCEDLEISDFIAKLPLEVQNTVHDADPMAFVDRMLPKNAVSDSARMTAAGFWMWLCAIDEDNYDESGMQETQSLSWKDVFLSEVQDVVMALSAEKELKRGQFELKEWLELRPVTISARPLMVLVRADLGLDPRLEMEPKCVPNTPDGSMSQLQFTVACVLGFQNDLLGWEKDHSSGNELNTAEVLIRDGYDMHTAVQALLDAHNHLVVQIQEMSDAVSSNLETCGNDMMAWQKYMDVIVGFGHGMADWMLSSDRYQIDSGKT